MNNDIAFNVKRGENFRAIVIEYGNVFYYIIKHIIYVNT